MGASLFTAIAGGFPRVDSPFFDASDPDLGGHRSLAEEFHRDGFALLPDLLTADTADRIIEEVEPLYRPDVAEGPRSHYRVQDAWEESPSVRALASHARVLELLEVLYGRRPYPFQTLNFRTGSQQRNHCDSIHFSSLPARFMCGVWTALEDTDADNGPLFYAPGSHQLPQLTLADLGMTLETANYERYEDILSEVVASTGLQYREVHVPKGTGFVWSSNLIHGGMPVKEVGRTRHSQVTHYFFDGCINYTPFFSEVPTGELFVRTPIDITSGQPVPPSLNDLPVRLEHSRGALVRIRYENDSDRVAAAHARLRAQEPEGSSAVPALDALLTVHQGRPDLQAQFGPPDAINVPELIAWALDYGITTDGAAPTLRGHEAGLRLLATRHGVTPTKPRRRLPGRLRAFRS